jgi:hypothetical protein
MNTRDFETRSERAVYRSASTTHYPLPSDVTDPLAQIEATRLAKKDLLQLVKTLNEGAVEDRMPEAHVEKAFEKCARS